MRCSKKQVVCGSLLGVLGLVLLAGGLLLLLGEPDYVRQHIKQQVVLTNGSDTYETWKDPRNLSIYLQIWVFDLQNPEEVLKGGRPNVTQKGPYTYQELIHKVDIDFHKDNGTVSYRQNHTYVFDGKMSVGDDNDNFTSVNFVPVTLLSALKSNLPVRIALPGLFKSVPSSESAIFATRSVREAIWGYTDPILKIAMKNYSQYVHSDQVGILFGKNNSNDGLFNIFTGEKNVSLLGAVNKYNDSSSLPFWSTKYANMINGTDGSLCRPFMTKDKKFYLFSLDICRSIYTTYQRDVSSEFDMNLWRFALTKDTFENATVNPDNAGFCTPPGNCLDSGVLNVASCRKVGNFSVPAVMSLPHFHFAAKHYVDAIEGMHPDSGDYNTEIDIEPHTGIVMAASKRMQLNMYLEKHKGYNQTGNITNMIFPVMWINESVTLDASHADKLRTELMAIQIINIVQYVALGLGVLMLLITVAYTVILLRKKIVDEGRPLIQAEDKD